MVITKYPNIYRFSVPSIMCGACAGSITRALNGIEDLPPYRYTVSVHYKMVYVGTSLPLTDNQKNIIKNEIKRLPSHQKVEELDMRSNTDEDTHTPSSLYPHVIKALMGCVGGAVSLYVAMSHVWMVTHWVYLIDVLGIGVSFYLGRETFLAARHSLIEERKLNMHVLFALNAITVIGVTVASWFFPVLPHLTYTALLLFGFKQVGDAIKQNIQQHSIKNVSYRERAPKKIEKFIDDKWQFVDVSSLVKGDIIRVHAGITVPVNGVCRRDSVVYEDILNGDAHRRIEKKYSDVNKNIILAGVRVVEDVDSLEMTVSHCENDSYLAQLDNDLIAAELERPAIEEELDRWMRYFIPAVLVLAVFAGSVFGWMSALSVMVGVCPCTIYTIIPSALSVCMKKAKDFRVFFTNTTAITEASDITTVFFDRTNTLTSNISTVSGHHLFSRQISSKKFFQLVYALEEGSSHPYARVISQYVKDSYPSYQGLTATMIDSSHHAGVKATIEGEDYFIGNSSFIRESRIVIPAHVDHAMSRYKMRGLQTILLANSKEVIGCLLLSDALRAGAKYVVSQLQAQGKSVWILTGTDQDTARATAKQLGIPDEHVIADCKDAGVKESHIKAFQMRGHRVAMIGDSTNDSLAMKASLGVLIKSSNNHSLAEKPAIIIEDESLYPVLTAFTLAKQMQRNKRESFAMTGFYNVAVMLFACGILKPMGCMMPPWVCMAMMFAQSIGVMLNVLRFKYQPIPHYTYACQEKDEKPWVSTAIKASQLLGVESKQRPSIVKMMEPVRHATKSIKKNPSLIGKSHQRRISRH